RGVWHAVLVVPAPGAIRAGGQALEPRAYDRGREGAVRPRRGAIRRPTPRALVGRFCEHAGVTHQTGLIVGRDRELEVTCDFISEVAHGPRALVVEGDPGIGKTAVWRTSVTEAQGRGCRVLRCVGAQADARLSFVGLRDLFGGVVDELIPALPAPQRDALERAL